MKGRYTKPVMFRGIEICIEDSKELTVFTRLADVGKSSWESLFPSAMAAKIFDVMCELRSVLNELAEEGGGGR